ncbi:MAG: ABC transporter ATP-binding protein [Candidatus Woesearchaeota archaeon]
MVAVIRLVNITKKFGEKTVLDNVNLEINSGEVFGIIGLSGSGKTTLLNTIIGSLTPNYGDVLFRMEHLLSYEDDKKQFRSVFKNEMDVRKVFGFASQTPSFYPKLTSIENLRYFGHLYNLSRDVIKTNSDILLKLMGIDDARNVLGGNLSGGMKKRLDIACALIHDPKILLLDEPTSDLDPFARRQMWNLIRQINEKGTTIILSSHFLDELEGLCDRVGILHNGQIICAGTPNEIKDLYSKEEEIRLETSPGKYHKIMERLSKESRLHIRKMQINENRLVIYTAKPERGLHQVLHILESMGEILIDVTVNKPSLQEVLENMIAKEGPK